MKRSISNNLLENHKLRRLQLWKKKEFEGWLLRLQNAFIHGPRSNNKTIGKGSTPPKTTMDVVQEDYNYKGNNSQSKEEEKGDRTMKWFNAFTTLNLETLCLRLNWNQNQKWYIDLRHELHKKQWRNNHNFAQIGSIQQALDFAQGQNHFIERKGNVCKMEKSHTHTHISSFFSVEHFFNTSILQKPLSSKVFYTFLLYVNTTNEPFQVLEKE